MTEQLKPCPFCNGKARIQTCDCDDVSFWKVTCENPKCFCSSAFFYSTREEAVAAWNDRPIENEKDAEIARLRDALDTIVGLFEINGGFWAVAEKMHETAKQALEKGKEE